MKVPQRVSESEVALTGSTYQIMRRTAATSVPRPKGRKVEVGIGTAGTRQVVRTSIAETLYRVSNETELVPIFDLDQREEVNLLRSVPPRVQLLYIAGKTPGQAALPFGLNGVPLSEQQERRGLWEPALRAFHSQILDSLKRRDVYPGLICQRMSPGGHAEASLTEAMWLAESFQHARRVAFIVAPEGDEQREQFMHMLAALDEMRVGKSPVVDTVVIPDNRLDPNRQDEMDAHLDAAAISAVTSGGQRGDNIANIFALARTELATDRVHYLTYRWARSLVPIHHPAKPSRLRSLLRREKPSESFTTPTVLAQDAYHVAAELASGGGKPAFLAPFSDDSGTALFLGIPSNSWDDVVSVKQSVQDQLLANKLVDHNRRGPIIGRYDLPNTKAAPLVGILLGEIAGGLDGVAEGLAAAPPTYIHSDHTLAPV